ncbi:GNAT family N-acetyltransferase [Chitinophaga nivalis]|uniref:GNAT family N-acetyltransferase n=1 Tax=Chitinophaga nivalis TaxID=2991709 RepID=A0ABT3IKT0_9BACT|nr:GNAT family N-acetyltransferase [Chitinophaga nivalis]MCW3465746.1 GNAT family N-acetyltransferase [Chitinophaga nivalis]MCW3484563.1 GNAT family N-acetyltransferase [Chitinophaga nivalis]
MQTVPVINSIGNQYSREVIDIILPIQQQEFNIPITLEDQPDLLDIENNYHRTGGGFWGASVNGELVGTIALISLGHQAGAVRKMFVRKAFRGKEFGIAQQLLQHLIAHSQQTGITDLYLGTVDKLAAAVRFYERNHFQQIAKADLPGYFPIMSADNVFYHLQLKAENV